MQNNKTQFILYPILFGIFPVLALLANNINELAWTNALRSIAFASISSLLIFAFINYIFYPPQKTALITLIIVIIFYSYGHLNYLLRDISFGGVELGRHRFLVPIYIFVAILLIWFVLRTKRDLSKLTNYLNWMGFFLIILPFTQISIYLMQKEWAVVTQEIIDGENRDVRLIDQDQYPDIYYILADGYPRSDFIEKYMDLDISPFINELRLNGFFVPTCSQANYSDTRFSMAATLNMTYLDNGSGEPEVNFSGFELDNMIKNNLVQKTFSELGYTIVTFDSGYRWLNWGSSDIHLKPPSPVGGTFLNIRFNEFEQLLLNTSLGKLLLDSQVILGWDHSTIIGNLINGPREIHRTRVLFSLEQIPLLVDAIPEPKFVYAHIVFPHPPFIVDSIGNPLNNTPQNELVAYADQITYLNNRLMSIVKEIIEKSKTPPVIILQGDHGATIDYDKHRISKSERLGIFSAYYLPNYAYEELQPTFSPVNNFRLIFDFYFDGEYGLLEDNSIIGRNSPFTRLPCQGN